MKKYIKVKKYILQIALTMIVILGTAIIFLLCDNGNKEQAQYIINTAKSNRDILFANTINGNMMYVPVSEKEGIAEATGFNGEKGYYLFTQLGDTVTISDDIMVSNQKNLYDMMLGILENGRTTKIEGCYTTKIKGTRKVIDLLSNKWGLTEGQTMGALNTYGAANTDNAQLELQIKSGDMTHFEFAINIYVDKKAYVVYRGVSLANNAYKTFPPELYAYRTYEGMRTDDARAFDYLNLMNEYFKEVAILINQ